MSGGLAIGYAVLAIVRTTELTAPGRHDVLRLCDAFMPASVSAESFAVLALGLLGAISVTRGLASAARQIAIQRGLVRGLRGSEPAVRDGGVIHVFNSVRPEAFCAGLIRPRIFVSRAAVDALTPDQLSAVIAHERYHLGRREPARLLVLRVLRDALVFLPALRQAEARYTELAEVAADEAALRRSGPQTLAAALLRLQPHTGGGVSIAAERVDHLLGEPVRWRLRASLLVAGALGLVLLAAGIFALAQAAPRNGVTGSMLAMQVCSVTMVALPLLAGAMIVRAARHVVTRRSR